MAYYKRLGPRHAGMVVRSRDALQYFNPDDELYDHYAKISKGEAHAIIVG